MSGRSYAKLGDRRAKFEAAASSLSSLSAVKGPSVTATCSDRTKE
jgi:hypothetical protein